MDNTKPKASDYTDKKQYNLDSVKWRYANNPEVRARVKSYQYNDTYTIYKITNSVNDKFYVGSTKQKLNNRLINHKRKSFVECSKSDFHTFIRSVSTRDNFNDIFKIQPIETGIVDKADAWKLEGEYIRTAGDMVLNQVPNSGKHIKSHRKCCYNDYYTVYEITNLYDNTVYVGVSHIKLNVVLSKHRTFALRANRKSEFHQFIRSASNHTNFNLVFSIKALQENIPDADMASEIKEQILQNYAERGKPTFNSRFIKKYKKIIE